MVKIDYKQPVNTSCHEVIGRNKCPHSCFANTEGYCGAYSKGMGKTSEYALKDTKGKIQGYYLTTSVEFKKPSCMASAPSNYEKTRLYNGYSTRETLSYADGRKKIILDTPTFKRIREKINGKWFLTEYTVKGNNKFVDALCYKNGALGKFDVTNANLKKVLEGFSGLTKKEFDKLAKAMLEHTTTVAKVLIRK